jgi:hypothetical protein
MSSVTTNLQSYPTNPADYLNGTALAQAQPSSGGGTEELINELLQMLQQALSALEGQSQSGGTSGSSGMPGGTGASGGAGMPGSAGLPTGSVGGATTPSSTSGGMTAQDSAATLSSYMSQNGINTMTPNELYSLSQNSNGNTPSTVSQAATYMLQNPNVYNQIETHDVPGADGKAGLNDLQWAAQGGLGAEGNTTGVAGGRSTMPGSAMPGSAMPGSTTPGSAMPGSTGGKGGMTAQDASATLSSYMSAQSSNNPFQPDSVMDPNQLYSLSQNSNGNTPPEVSQAATYMLQNPSIYNQIETHDVPGADGKAGLNDLQWAAQGGLGTLGNSTGVARQM